MSHIVDTKEVILTSDATGTAYSAATWDAQTGRLISNYKSAGALANRTLTILSDSYVLGADTTKPRLHIWPLNSQCPVSNLSLTTPGKVTALTSTPNGAYIVAAIGEKLYLWQVCNGRLLATLTRHYQTITCLTFSKDGSIFASGGDDGLVFVWSLYEVINEESSPVHAFSHHSLPVKDLYFGRSGSRAKLCSVSLDHTANIYEANSGLLLLKLVFNTPLTAICMNTRETDLFVGHANGIITKFNLHNPPREIEHNVEDNEENIFHGRNNGSIITMSVSVDCKILLTASGTEVNLWDIASRIILVTIEHKGPVTAAFFTKRFGNFNAVDLKPSIQIANLQKGYGDYPEGNVVDIIRREQDVLDILNFDFFVECKTDFGNTEEQTSRKFEEMREELDKLKKINAAIYKYSIECILNKK